MLVVLKANLLAVLMVLQLVVMSVYMMVGILVVEKVY